MNGISMDGKKRTEERKKERERETKTKTKTNTETGTHRDGKSQTKTGTETDSNGDRDSETETDTVAKKQRRMKQYSYLNQKALNGLDSAQFIRDNELLEQPVYECECPWYSSLSAQLVFFSEIILSFFSLRPCFSLS